MSDCIKVLTHKNRLKAALKGLGLDDLLKLQDNIAEFIELSKDELERQKELEQQKQQNIEEVRKIIADKGLSFEEVIGEVAKEQPVSGRSIVKQKYQIIDENGELHRWSGRGRAPKPFQKYFDAGNSKESCLIED